MSFKDIIISSDYDFPCSNDPNLFFVNQGESTKLAKRICAICKYINECLKYSYNEINTRQYGVWGGYTPMERKELRKIK